MSFLGSATGLLQSVCFPLVRGFQRWVLQSFLLSQCASPHSRSARPLLPHLTSVIMFVPHIMTPAHHPQRSFPDGASGELFLESISQARTAAGRVRPQQETFRCPTTILVDPAPSSAALVDMAFVPKSFAKLWEIVPSTIVHSFIVRGGQSVGFWLS